jgi:CMP-N-acetylneuraminic acid synthetase
MRQGKTFLAVIPARGGSKGLPGKNILPFLGKPLLLYTLGEARKSKYLDRIIVSTDDQEIKGIALAAGAEVIDRPAELAQDHSTTESALIQVIDYLEISEDRDYDYVVTLQVTSPLRTAVTIDRAIEKILSGNYDSLFSC